MRRIIGISNNSLLDIILTVIVLMAAGFLIKRINIKKEEQRKGRR
jgi:predicted permease